jgi:hypothetical protein
MDRAEIASPLAANVPQPHRGVVGARNRDGAIITKCARGYSTGVAVEDPTALSRCEIPQS